jgi:lipoyl(octanoyl) transferase
LAIQEELLLKRQENKADDTLILVEHPPVITLGRRGNYENILLPRQLLEEQGVKVYEVGRGGDVTYHGPGQVVGYPIIHLGAQGKDVKQYVWNLEETFIKLLDREYGIKANREEGKFTGV